MRPLGVNRAILGKARKGREGGLAVLFLSRDQASYLPQENFRLSLTKERDVTLLMHQLSFAE
jgi:hypothetical protein